MDLSTASGNPFWKKLLACAPDSSETITLMRSRLQQISPCALMAGFTPEEMLVLNHAIGHYMEKERILRILAVMYDALFESSPETAGGQDFEPNEDETGDSRIFLLVSLLCYAPRLRKDYEKRGWSSEMYKQALRDFKIWSDFTLENEHRIGLTFSGGYSWIHAQMLCRILRFGRLQCNIEAHFFDDLMVFRNRLNGRLQVLMNGNMEFNARGLYRVEGEEALFHSSKIQETEEGFCGTPVSPDGFASPEPVLLKKQEWTPVLLPGAPVINLHIPADGPLLPSMCADSVQRMWGFFHTKTDLKVQAVVCESWLLDPVFPELLPPSSNMLQFQMAGYLMPEKGPSDCFRRVFGVKGERDGIETVPWNTSMRRAFGKYYVSGGKFRNGRIVLMPEDFPWGSNPYRPAGKKQIV